MGVAQLVARTELMGKDLSLNPTKYVFGEGRRILTVTKVTFGPVYFRIKSYFKTETRNKSFKSKS